MQHLLIRDARVDVKQHINEKRQNEAVITIGDAKGEKFQHRFKASSRISKHLDLMTAKDLQKRMDGGTYFFIDGELVEFRDGMYHGFSHDDHAIDVFMEKLGAQQRSALPLHRGSPRKRRNDDGESDYVLRKVWSQSEIIIPGYAHGADFNSQLSFTWSPFNKTINSAFDLVRLICTNGMIGMTSFLNTKIPLFNRWDEHLDIASRQIQNKVNSVVSSRIDTMAVTPASVGDCLLLEEHAFERLNTPDSGGTGDRQRLLNLLAAVAPKEHLSLTYKDNVFVDKALAAQLPAHLSQFDAFNIATELRTHTIPTNKSSDRALDKFANEVLFEDLDSSKMITARTAKPLTASFSDPERAFFGQISEG